MSLLFIALELKEVIDNIADYSFTIGEVVTQINNFKEDYGDGEEEEEEEQEELSKKKRKKGKKGKKNKAVKIEEKLKPFTSTTVDSMREILKVSENSSWKTTLEENIFNLK